VASAAAAAYVLLQLLGRRAGSSQDERQRALPGDDLVPRPQIVTDHAVTLDVASEDIWPWLTQMGWHLGGYYTPTGSTGCCFRRTGQAWITSTRRWSATCTPVTSSRTVRRERPGLSWKKLMHRARSSCTRRRMCPLDGVSDLV
jgi:hypothetical protein